MVDVDPVPSAIYMDMDDICKIINCWIILITSLIIYEYVYAHSMESHCRLLKIVTQANLLFYVIDVSLIVS